MLLKEIRLPSAWRARSKQPRQPIRQFSQNSQLSITRRSTRPEVPFLTQPIPRYPRSAIVDFGRRLASTDSNNLIRETAWRTVLIGVPLFALMSAGYAIHDEYKRQLEEFADPTPIEWSTPTRQAARLAHKYENLYRVWRFVPWAYVATEYTKALSRLEDPAIDGADIIKQEDEDVGQMMIAGLSSMGFDISQKSWAWKEAYFRALLGLATAVEQMEPFVKDKTRNLIFPESVVVGPSNPDPRPVSHRMPAAPLERDCVQAFDAPEVVYMKILTTIGFSTQQRLQAALSYAGYLSSQRLDNAAEDMFRWAVDIAKAPLRNYGQILDEKTFVLRHSEDPAVGPSENLLQAVKALALHRARSGDTAAALPIFLSILRAKHEAPVSDKRVTGPRLPTPPVLFEQYLHGHKWSDEDKSLDQPYRRTTRIPDCEDSELMLYIGEIIYATSPKHEEGELWTKRSVENSKKSIGYLNENKELNLPAFKDFMRCKQCLQTGAKNWTTMLTADIEQIKSRRESNEIPSSWISWLKPHNSVSDEELDAMIDTLQSKLEVAQDLEQKVSGGEVDDGRYQSLSTVPFQAFKG